MASWITPCHFFTPLLKLGIELDVLPGFGAPAREGCPRFEDQLLVLQRCRQAPRSVFDHTGVPAAVVPGDAVDATAVLHAVGWVVKFSWVYGSAQV